MKLTDTVEAVTRVLAGKIAGQMDGGGIDLIWINGENFAAMKRQELLFGPILHLLPNMKFVDPKTKPTILSDFTVPTDGYESPWGMAQLVFFHDAKRVPQPPRSPAALLAFAKSNPGRFTYPAPPDFIGSTVLKQFLLSLAANRASLSHPLDESRFGTVTAPLWDYLTELAPHLWRGVLRKVKWEKGTRFILVFISVSFHSAISPLRWDHYIIKYRIKIPRVYLIPGGFHD